MVLAGELEVFFSYSHKDERLRDNLANHLSQLKHEGLIRDWHDRRISAGTEWDGQISRHLNSAHIILLLVSSDFLASSYCHDVEVKRAMEQHEAGGVRVIPVILRPCDWHSAPFGKLQALPKDGRAITSWSNRDTAFTDVAKGIRLAVNELVAAAKEDNNTPIQDTGDLTRQENTSIQETGDLKAQGPLQNPQAGVSTSESTDHQVVLLVHGIRTHASWGEMVASKLEVSGSIDVIPLRYGYFDVFRFWFPFYFRKRVADRILREIRTAQRDYPGRRISVIAHSFGTYTIGRILLDNPDIRLYRLILCGSVLPSHFRWDKVSHQVVGKILNECGTRDIWPVLAQSTSWGYGASGTFGYGTVTVRDRFHDAGHSQYFQPAFVEEYWSPFIKKGTIERSTWDTTRPPVRWWISVLSILPIHYLSVALLVLVLCLGLSGTKNKDCVAESQDTAEIVAKKMRDGVDQKVLNDLYLNKCVKWKAKWTFSGRDDNGAPIYTLIIPYKEDGETKKNRFGREIGLNVFAHFAPGRDEPISSIGKSVDCTIKGVITHIGVNLVNMDKCELVR